MGQENRASAKGQPQKCTKVSRKKAQKGEAAKKKRMRFLE
jgi:hypothetical protein